MLLGRHNVIRIPYDSYDIPVCAVDFPGIKSLNIYYHFLQATNVSGLVEKLETIQSQLSLCEKALAEYLETKRLAFPRFYFASSNDLLDILSNGNQPLKVAKHLTKLFDSMAKLKLKDGRDCNKAFAMIAKDGEQVLYYLLGSIKYDKAWST